MNCSIVNPDWSRLQGECATFEDAHYADSTKQTRSVQVKAYIEFCEVFVDRISPYPCKSDQVCMYMSYLARRMCYNSIRQYLSALNNHLKDVDCPPIDYKNHRVRKCLSGIRRSLGDAPRQAPPLLPQQLLQLFAIMLLTPGHVVLRAAILLSFRALLRKCHVSDSASSLIRSDFTFFRWGMMVKVRKSKTIQYRERTHLIPVSSVLNPALCAVYWVRKHFADTASDPEGKAFRLPSGGGSVPMPYSFYLSSLKLLCARAGLQPGKFTTHSLRRGGATFLRQCGASILEIKERGDWKSDAVFEYLRAPIEERLASDIRVAAMLANGIR